MSGDIMSTWPIRPVDPKRQTTNYDGKIHHVGRDFVHGRPVPLVDTAASRVAYARLMGMPVPVADSKACVGDEQYE